MGNLILGIALLITLGIIVYSVRSLIAGRDKYYTDYKERKHLQ
jgi:hypothetical protein